MTSLVTVKAIKKNVWQMPESSKYLQRDLVLGNGHLFVQVLKRSGILEKRIVHKQAWDHIADEMLLEFAESGHPTFRATTPLSRCILKSKGRGKLSIHFAADQDTIDTIYRIILSVNQLSVHGAVAAVCEEFEGHQDRSGEPDVLMGQSIVLGEVKAEALLHNENPMNDQIIWQQYIQQVEAPPPSAQSRQALHVEVHLVCSFCRFVCFLFGVATLVGSLWARACFRGSRRFVGPCSLPLWHLGLWVLRGVTGAGPGLAFRSTSLKILRSSTYVAQFPWRAFAR